MEGLPDYQLQTSPSMHYMFQPSKSVFYLFPVLIYPAFVQPSKTRYVQYTEFTITIPFSPDTWTMAFIFTTSRSIRVLNRVHSLQPIPQLAHWHLQVQTWHCRLGHINHGYLKTLFPKEQLQLRTNPCTIYILSKHESSTPQTTSKPSNIFLPINPLR